MQKQKKPIWTCPRGCSISKTPCPHLDALLPAPQGGDGSTRLAFIPVIDQAPETALSPEGALLSFECQKSEVNAGIDRPDAMSEAELSEKMRNFGISEKKISVIEARLFHGETWRVIAERVGYQGAPEAARAFIDAMAQLRKRGFKI
jgi:hypothetical protein